MSRRLCFALDLIDDAELIAEYDAAHAPNAAWPEITADIYATGFEDMAIGQSLLHDRVRRRRLSPPSGRRCAIRSRSLGNADVALSAGAAPRAARREMGADAPHLRAGRAGVMRMSIHVVLAAAVLVLTTLTAATRAGAEVRLPHILGDHMVLQAEQPIRIWGWAAPGERVAVRLAGVRRAARADPAGRWQVSFPPRRASATPITLTVDAANHLVVDDILIGEVWLAGGQSNMDKPIGPWVGQQPTTGWQATLASATSPTLRFFDVADKESAAPAEDIAGHWFVATPETLAATHFSAIAYLFARTLHDALGRPAAVINTAVGGSRIESWMPADGFATLPSLANVVSDWKAAPASMVGTTPPAAFWNGMIAPLTLLRIEGLLWYQGESNVLGTEDGALYADKMVAMVEGWRRAWGVSIPFYYVQIAPFLYHVISPDKVVSPTSGARLMAAQAAAEARIAKSGMVVTTDITGDITDLHPIDKPAVAERLAHWALAKDYGESRWHPEHPRFTAMTVSGDRVTLAFSHALGLRVNKGTRPDWFQIAGADGRFHPADATIVGTEVILSSTAVAHPIAVRFGWDEAARPNLVNGEGLPVVPFRTDGDEVPPVFHHAE